MTVLSLAAVRVLSARFQVPVLPPRGAARANDGAVCGMTVIPR